VSVWGSTAASLANIAHPADYYGDKHFEASVLPAVTESKDKPNPFKKTSICFKTNPKPPIGRPFQVVMQCAEGGKCSLDSNNDVGWAAETECSDNHTQTSRSFNLVPTLLAESLDRSATQGWTVPSLTTLKQMKDSRRAGYTEFSIKANPVPGLEAADRFRYEIIANGASLSVDGWPPEDMLKEFNASKGLDFSFGMENLSFSGADRGCENIGVVLEFRKGNFGIVVGLVQPSGQVKFTFDTTDVQQLRNWVLQQDRSIFQYPAQHPPFVYQSKPGPADTGALKWCSTVAG
jgi:hypothetical protein